MLDKMKKHTFLKELTTLYEITETCDGKYFFQDYQNVLIQINPDNDTYDIFVEFIYPLYDKEEDEGLLITEVSEAFVEILKDKMGKEPQVFWEDYMGAPFDVETVGYFDVGVDCSFVKTFIEIYENIII